MGIMQNWFQPVWLLAAPILLVVFATAYGRHRALFIRYSRTVRFPALALSGTCGPAAASDHASLPRLREICAIKYSAVPVISLSYLVICWAFAPLFLTKERGFTPTQMGWLLGTLGVSATFGSFIVSGISDRIGRRPVIVFTCFLGVILPMGALFYHGSIWILAVFFFFGWALTGAFPLFMGTIPSETVSVKHMTTANGDHREPEVIGGVVVLLPSPVGRRT